MPFFCINYNITQQNTLNQPDNGNSRNFPNTEPNQTTYTPGVCNLDKVGTLRRKRMAILGAVSTVFTIAGILLVPVPHLVRLIIFVPLFMAILGFQQTRHRFCVMFGMMGLFALAGTPKPENVLKDDYRELDRKKALQMIITSLAFSLLLTALFYFLPF